MGRNSYEVFGADPPPWKVVKTVTTTKQPVAEKKVKHPRRKASEALKALRRAWTDLKEDRIAGCTYELVECGFWIGHAAPPRGAAYAKEWTKMRTSLAYLKRIGMRLNAWSWRGGTIDPDNRWEYAADFQKYFRHVGTYLGEWRKEPFDYEELNY